MLTAMQSDRYALFSSIDRQYLMNYYDNAERGETVQSDGLKMCDRQLCLSPARLPCICLDTGRIPAMGSCPLSRCLFRKRIDRGVTIDRIMAPSHDMYISTTEGSIIKELTKVLYLYQEWRLRKSVHCKRRHLLVCS